MADSGCPGSDASPSCVQPRRFGLGLVQAFWRKSAVCIRLLEADQPYSHHTRPLQSPAATSAFEMIRPNTAAPMLCKKATKARQTRCCHAFPPRSLHCRAGPAQRLDRGPLPHRVWDARVRDQVAQSKATPGLRACCGTPRSRLRTGPRPAPQTPGWPSHARPYGRPPAGSPAARALACFLLGLVLIVVGRPPGTKGFAVLPRRSPAAYGRLPRRRVAEGDDRRADARLARPLAPPVPRPRAPARGVRSHGHARHDPPYAPPRHPPEP